MGMTKEAAHIGQPDDVTNVGGAGHSTRPDLLIQNLAVLAETLPQIVWFDTVEGFTQFVNRRWVEYTGLSAGDSLGHGMRHAIHPADLAAALALWESALQAGVPFEHDLRLRRHDGSYRWHHCRSAPFYADDGQQAGWFGTATDIDERRRATDQIQFQANLLQAVKQAVVVTDLAGRITYWNRFAEQLYGWPAAQTLGRQIREIVPASDIPISTSNLRAILERGESWSGEILVQRRDGSPLLISLVDSPLTDAEGKLVGIVGVSSDITARKRQERQLHLLLEISTDLAASLDPQRMLQRVAERVVPSLADWCAVDLLTPDGVLELVAVAHVDPAKRAWAQALRQRHPATLSDDHGPGLVARTGKAQLLPALSPAQLAAANSDPVAAALLRASGLHSLIIVPLRGLGQISGTLTLIWSESERTYSEDDLRFAEELARRAAMAVDNARLYSEMQQAERQQAEVSAQLESLLLSSPIGFAFFDREHRYVRINEQLATINGLPVEAHLGRPIREVLPVNAQMVEPILDQVFATGVAVNNLEVSGETPLAPGVLRHWLTSFYPVVAAGETLLVGATVWEITERKQVEAALRASEARFRATFEQAAVGMAHVDLAGRWLVVNNRLCEIVGYSREELLELTFQAITHPDDLEADLAQVRRLLAGEIEGYQLEKRYIRRSGELVWIFLTVSLQRDPLTQTPNHFIVVVENINERKEAEIQLSILAEATKVLTAALEPELRAQALADLLTPRLADWCVVNLLQGDGRIELMAAAHRDPTQVAELRLLAQQHPLTLADNQGTPQVIRTGRPLFYPEITPAMVTRDERLELLHQLRLTSLIIVPLRARGQTLGAMTLARTDARRLFSEGDLHFAEELGRRIGLAVDNARLYQEARDAESRLLQLAETLELRVAERTAELERSNRELDQFAYVASHDLKAPLRAIDNLSSWIEEDASEALPAPSREHLVKLRGRVQRMERLLDDLLAYSRAGRIQHRPERVEMGALVRGVVELQALPAGFHCSIEGDLGPVNTVRVPLETVLRNLIGNAIKHHNRSDGRLQITVRDQGDSLHFTVADDGPGISAQYHQRIFEMFQILQPRDRVEGSGMGLAIVKKLVESVGGQVALDSDEGRGATFSFTWPRM